MRYTVVWVSAAERELGDLWLQASDRRDVADAADEIDRRLRLTPLSVGASYDDDRLLTVPPLEVVYRVSPDDYLVTVLSVWRL